MSNLEDLFNKAKSVNLDDVIAKAKEVDLDGVLSKTKEVAETVTKLGSDRLELSRRKVELLNLKNKLSRAFEHFGELQYASINGEQVFDEELQMVITEIADLKAKKETIEMEIEQAPISSSCFTKSQETVNSDEVSEVEVEIVENDSEEK